MVTNQHGGAAHIQLIVSIGLMLLAFFCMLIILSWPFNGKQLYSTLQGAFKKYIGMLYAPSETNLIYQRALDDYSDKIVALQVENAWCNTYVEALKDAYKDIIAQYRAKVNECIDLYEEITALKQIVKSLREQKKIYEGQKYYNPADHSAPTVWVSCRFNDWLMITPGKDARPIVMSYIEFKEAYPAYELMPRIKDNRKFL